MFKSQELVKNEYDMKPVNQFRILPTNVDPSIFKSAQSGSQVNLVKKKLERLQHESR